MPITSLDPGEYRQSALYRYLMEPTQEVLGRPPTALEGRVLSQGSLNELDVEAHDLALEFMRLYEDGVDPDGRPLASAPGQEVVSDFEKSVILGIMNNRRDSGYFLNHARTPQLLHEKYGLPLEEIHPPEIGTRPVDEGEIDLGPRVSQYSASRLASGNISQLPELFRAEVVAQRRELQADVTGVRTMGLLRDYCAALWSKGQQPSTEQVADQLLDILYKGTPNGKQLAAKNLNGAPWGIGQSLALGMDPNKFTTNFPKATHGEKVTYLQMDGEMSGPMKHLDKFLAAKGRPQGAEKYELQSPLNFLIGEQTGHYKRGNLNEEQPFSSSGVNWGLVLFPQEAARIRGIEFKEDKEFAIDCLDGLNQFIRCIPSQGDRMELVDKANKRPVQAQVQVEGDGDAKRWYATFTQDGRALEPAEVMGIIKDAGGRIKGDSKTEGEADMWWWGFCDRYTGQAVFKVKYEIPELDVETVKVKSGNEVIEVPLADAQQLVDADINDIVTGSTFCGFRFNNETTRVQLKNGTTIEGRIPSEVFESSVNTARIGGDTVALFDAPGKPLLGTVGVKTEWGTQSVHVRNIVSIEKDAADTSESPKVKIKTKEGDYEDEVEGELLSKIKPELWQVVDGKKVVKQTADFAVRGDIEVTTPFEGEKRIAASDIHQITGESSKDMRISDFVTWVARQNGVFATDGDPEVVVSNGQRWVNDIDMDERASATDRPQWAPMEPELLGQFGVIDFQPGDKMTWVRGLMESEWGDGEVFTGWVQTRKGRIVNEQFLDGIPDFGWGAEGPLDWTKKSSFNPFVDPAFRIGLVVNGISTMNDELATKLNLPSNWRDYQVA